MSAATLSPLPGLFLSHGSPMIAIEPGAAGMFMQRLGPAIDRVWGRPRAIVVMSAHTAAPSLTVVGAARHDTVHDFGGFPAPLYKIRYDAPGDPALADEVARLLTDAGMPASSTPKGGLDHGIWTALMHLYPEADVPVVPVSLTPHALPVDVLAQGRALHGLADTGVLMIGSGSMTHNLRRFFTQPAAVDAPEHADCAAFRAWVADRTETDDWTALLDYRDQAPHASQMHPTDEHWLPFYFAAGAGALADEDVPELSLRLHASVTYGHLAMDAYAFGPGAAALAAAVAND